MTDLIQHSLLVACLLVGLAGSAGAQDPKLLRQASLSRAKGSAEAPVLVYEIADFQCPYCARFSREVFPSLDSAYVQPGKVQWVFVNMPIPSHPRAWSAAKAALCAGAVADRFWAIQGRLFEAQQEWSMAEDPFELFERYATEAGVPTEPYRRCMFADQIAAVLLEDVFFASSARISGTPTFIIDREEVVVGYRSFEEWREILDARFDKAAERP